jgi:catalase
MFQNTVDAKMLVNPDIDTELGEKPHKDEEANTLKIAALISEGIRARYQPVQCPALRDAHPKSHGCVKATFTINQDLAPELAQGVFVPGRTYPAVIRFSNGDPDPMRPDVKPDARGMAIKLLNVPGDKILHDERDARTHDFIMINHPVFFLDDPARYLDLQKLQRAAANPGTLQKVMSALVANHARLENLLTKLALSRAVGVESANLIMSVTASKIVSPLTTRYWSMSAYRLGDPPHKYAVKFSARPKVEVSSPIPVNPSRNYLRETMIKQLATNQWQFDFQVQRKPPEMSVENTMVEWPETTRTPFENVATITINRQQFAMPARDQFCEGLSFTPWHALPQHRPLGVVNRMRRVAYETVSKLRHELNGTQRREPTEQDVP